MYLSAGDGRAWRSANPGENQKYPDRHQTLLHRARVYALCIAATSSQRLRRIALASRVGAAVANESASAQTTRPTEAAREAIWAQVSRLLLDGQHAAGGHGEDDRHAPSPRGRRQPARAHVARRDAGALASHRHEATAQEMSAGRRRPHGHGGRHRRRRWRSVWTAPAGLDTCSSPRHQDRERRQHPRRTQCMPACRTSRKVRPDSNPGRG